MRIVWAIEEMILAADAADDLGWRGVNSRTRQVEQLSELLRTARYHPIELRDNNFRTPGSVGMKINNLNKSHPEHRGVGLRTTASEAQIVQLFLEDRRSAKFAASALRRDVAEGRERLGDAKKFFPDLF